MITRDGNAIDDPTTEAWRVFHECPSELTPAQRDLLEKEYCYQTMKAWEDAKLHMFDLSKVSDERRAILENSICYQTTMAWEDVKLYNFDLSKLSDERRAILGKDHLFRRSMARRLLP